jgi:cytochrome b
MAGANGRRVRVWDPVVRLSHWSLAVLVIANLVNDGSSSIHRQLGYAAVIVVGARIMWGLVATGHARLSSFRPRLRALFEYVRAMRARQPVRYLGHNPAAAWMIVTLWSLLGLLALSGWLMRLDYFWGDEWLQNLHALFAYLLLAAVGVHIAAAVLMSILHRENLIAAMIHGDKRAPDNDDQSSATTQSH